MALPIDLRVNDLKLPKILSSGALFLFRKPSQSRRALWSSSHCRLHVYSSGSAVVFRKSKYLHLYVQCVCIPFLRAIYEYRVRFVVCHCTHVTKTVVCDLSRCRYTWARLFLSREHSLQLAIRTFKPYIFIHSSQNRSSACSSHPKTTIFLPIYFILYSFAVLFQCLQCVYFSVFFFFIYSTACTEELMRVFTASCSRR